MQLRRTAAFLRHSSAATQTEELGRYPRLHALVSVSECRRHTGGRRSFWICARLVPGCSPVTVCECAKCANVYGDVHVRGGSRAYIWLMHDEREKKTTLLIWWSSAMSARWLKIDGGSGCTYIKPELTQCVDSLPSTSLYLPRSKRVYARPRTGDLGASTAIRRRQ